MLGAVMNLVCNANSLFPSSQGAPTLQQPSLQPPSTPRLPPTSTSQGAYTPSTPSQNFIHRPTCFFHPKSSNSSFSTTSQRRQPYSLKERVTRVQTHFPPKFSLRTQTPSRQHYTSKQSPTFSLAFRMYHTGLDSKLQVTSYTSVKDVRTFSSLKPPF